MILTINRINGEVHPKQEDQTIKQPAKVELEPLE